ncbi:hypothetical protein IFM89_019146 [Coptis chinensis]|uniref:Uncharacterized protein n=1 Tax=Coptis chinensis TaxID=261450 RepID=A0A835H5E1_9MAGN|nr:hypothetical protein IFM89_019146 [Coptis chinensis]
MKHWSSLDIYNRDAIVVSTICRGDIGFAGFSIFDINSIDGDGIVHHQEHGPIAAVHKLEGGLIPYAFGYVACILRIENLKVHENRRQLFSSSASKDSASPFVRQRPLAAKTVANALNPPPPPWAYGAGAGASAGVLCLRRKNLSTFFIAMHSTGFARGSSKYRGATLHKCGRWEARMGLFLGKK